MQLVQKEMPFFLRMLVPGGLCFILLLLCDFGGYACLYLDNTRECGKKVKRPVESLTIPLLN
jgi:hypothetical protein